MTSNKSNLFLALLLPVQILFVQIAAHHANLVEAIYSKGIYPYISHFLRLLFGWIPFSIGDLLLAFLLFSFFRFIYKLISTRCKKCYQQLIKLIAFLSVIYGCFYLFWGMNYYRESLAKNLQLPSASYTTADLIKVTQKLIKKTNEIQVKITSSDTLKVVNPYRPKEMYKKALIGFTILSEKYPQLKYKHLSVKSSLMSSLQSYNGTSGYMNPLTGEAQVNDKIPKTGYPVVTCHEMAHQIGWAAENEANFVGFLAATSNTDIYFKYAGYKMATQYLLSELYKRDKNEYQKIYTSINKGIKKDFKESYLFWKSYKNPFEPLVKKGYNAYLKANKQTKGIQSYNYVVDLLIAYLKKEKLSSAQF